MLIEPKAGVLPVAGITSTVSRHSIPATQIFTTASGVVIDRLTNGRTKDFLNSLEASG